MKEYILKPDPAFFRNFPRQCWVCSKWRNEADVHFYKRDISHAYGEPEGFYEFSHLICYDNLECLKGAKRAADEAEENPQTIFGSFGNTVGDQV